MDADTIGHRLESFVVLLNRFWLTEPDWAAAPAKWVPVFVNHDVVALEPAAWSSTGPCHDTHEQERDEPQHPPFSSRCSEDHACSPPPGDVPAPTPRSTPRKSMSSSPSWGREHCEASG